DWAYARRSDDAALHVGHIHSDDEVAAGRGAAGRETLAVDACLVRDVDHAFAEGAAGGNGELSQRAVLEVERARVGVEYIVAARTAERCSNETKGGAATIIRVGLQCGACKCLGFTTESGSRTGDRASCQIEFVGNDLVAAKA